MRGAARGVCVLHKESSHLRGPLLIMEQTHERRCARRLRASQHVVKRSLMTCAHISALPLPESSHLRGPLLMKYNICHVLLCS